MHVLSTYRKSFYESFLEFFLSVLPVFFGLFFYLFLSKYHLSQFNAAWRPQVYGYVLDHLITYKTCLVFATVVYVFYAASRSFFSDSFYSVGHHFFAGLSKIFARKKLDDNEARVLLFAVLKFFFLPYLFNGLIHHLKQINYLSVDLYRYFFVADDVDKLQIISNDQLFVFNFVFSLICLIDLLPFVCGYLFQRPGSELKSVDKSLFGWVVCLLCYPPFNASFGAFFPLYTPEYIGYELGSYGIYFNVASLFFLLCFALCSINLGWRASNLTSRGVVSTGFYSIVRHPAYTFKLCAWFVCAVGGFCVRAVQDQPRYYELITLVAWAALYYARALTEERHLLSTDADYADYCERVRYRFIPFLI